MACIPHRCFVCLFVLQSVAHSLESDHLWPSLLDKLCKALRMNRVVFLSRQVELNATMAVEAIRNGPRTIKFISDSFNDELSLMDSKENLVIDTSDMENNRLLDIISDNMELIGIRAPSVIVLNSLQDLESKQLPEFRINQKVYFLLLEEGVITERYTVNDQFVSRTLFSYNQDTELFDLMQGIEPDVVLRRSNFQGVNLKVFVGYQAPYLTISDRAEDREDVRELTEGGIEMEVVYPEQLRGIFREIQVIMETELNFTSTYYQRIDKTWGDRHQNGSFYGMIGDVNKGHMDLISASVTVKQSRAFGVNYLRPIGTETYALFVPTTGREELAWRVFLLPFSDEVWILLAIYALLGALVIRLIWGTSNLSKECSPILSRIQGVLSLIWSVVCGYLGGRPPAAMSGHNNAPAVRMAIFASFFFGTVVWAAYRASLTSELVNVVDSKPFDSLQGFLDSDYQMIARIGGASEHVLKSASEGNIYNKLYKKNLRDKHQADEYFIPDVAPALAKLWESDVKTAYYYVMETVLTYKQYECKLFAPWVSHYPKFLSMAVPPDSQYFPFMDRFVLRHIEKGTITLLNKRWKSTMPECESTDGDALTLEKTVSVFFIWAAGAVAGVGLLVFELLANLSSLSNRTALKERLGRRKPGRRKVDPGVAERMKELARKVEEDECVDKRLFVKGLEDLIRVLRRADQNSKF